MATLSALFALGACLDSSVTPVSTITPAAMVLVSGGAQMGAAGNTLPLPVTVRLTDQSGLPVSLAAVSFSPAASSGTVSASSIFTDTTGSAGVLWTLGTAIGVDSLNVSVPGLPTVTVTAQVTTGAPATIAVVSGDAQTAPAGTTLSTPLVVRVTDQFGYAVPNARVSWSSDANGGYAFASASSVTDADGKAQAVYTLGATAGLQHVTVMVSTATGAMLATISATGT
jgi:protocatechuate 3,4-dioxygenase beta subunit